MRRSFTFALFAALFVAGLALLPTGSALAAPPITDPGPVGPEPEPLCGWLATVQGVDATGNTIWRTIFISGQHECQSAFQQLLASLASHNETYVSGSFTCRQDRWCIE